MIVHNNQYFAVTNQNHGGEEEGMMMFAIMSWAWISQDKYFCHCQSSYLAIWIGRRWWVTWLSCILRSWLHDILIHSRTVSPQLEDNNESKCISNNFPHPTYMSPCVENCQNYISMYLCSLIAGKRSRKVENLWDKSVP